MANEAATTKEAKIAAIQTAASVKELDALWAKWEESGWSREGLMYARVLARKAELGVELTDDEVASVELAARKLARGAKLPPVSGEMKK